MEKISKSIVLWKSCPSEQRDDVCESLQSSWLSGLQQRHNDNKLSEYVEESDSLIVYLKQGLLTPPMAGVTFSMNPHFKNSVVLVSVGVRYKFRFPDQFLWNQGGMLPGLQGVYNRESGTLASAVCAFDCRCRWDAKGKLGIGLKRCLEDNPLEWTIETQEKVQLVKNRWYSVEIVAHIDGHVQLTVDEHVLFDGMCNYGFESLAGVRLSAHCTDNTALEDAHIELRNIEIVGQVDAQDGASAKGGL